MRTRNSALIYSLPILAGIFTTAAISRAGLAPSAEKIPVTMTVTASVADKKRMPEIGPDNILVKQGKENLEVTGWVPARGDRAGLELFILIDDNADTRIALQYEDLRLFIGAQPATTLVGVGYMRNGTVQIAQDLSTNHDLAMQALRLPVGHAGAMQSPYLSVVDLMKRWPASQNRREVIMLTNGIGRHRHHLAWRSGFTSDPDVDTASAVAQRTGTNIHAVYTLGARFNGSYWAAANGQLNMARLSDRTGGASFYPGMRGPVALKPYLAQIQTAIDNQYLLSFLAKSGKKPGLQAVNVSTEVAGVEFASHDAVWVPVRK